MNEYLVAAVAAGIAIVFGGIGGVLFGLWFGERGRRKDLMWYTQQSQRPKDLDQSAEFDFRPNPEDEALHQAELQAVRENLRQELRVAGRTASDKEIEEEALRIVTQMETGQFE